MYICIYVYICIYMYIYVYICIYNIYISLTCNLIFGSPLGVSGYILGPLYKYIYIYINAYICYIFIYTNIPAYVEFNELVNKFNSLTRIITLLTANRNFSIIFSLLAKAFLSISFILSTSAVDASIPVYTYIYF